MQTGFAHINGASIYYEAKGSGQPLIMVHGMGLDCRMWDSQFHALADKYHVIRYDLRGFGKSSLPTEESYAHHTDLHALLGHFGISKANLMGLSMGGRVVVDYALTYPQYAKSLVMVDSVVHGYPFQKNFSTEAVNTAAKEGGPKAANEAWLRHDLFVPANRNPVVAAQLKSIVDNYSGWHWVNKNPWIPIEPQAVTRLSDIAAPSLIVVGEEDLPDFRGISDLLHEQIAGSKKVVMQNVGHMSNMEDPENFNHIVRIFLDTVNEAK